jgi:hypothetical protein
LPGDFIRVQPAKISNLKVKGVLNPLVGKNSPANLLEVKDWEVLTPGEEGKVWNP